MSTGSQRNIIALRPQIEHGEIIKKSNPLDRIKTLTGKRVYGRG